MFAKKTISHKKIWEIHNYTSISQPIRHKKSNKNIFKIFIIIICIIAVWFCGKYILHWAHLIANQIWKSTISIVSNTIWKQMQKDEFGNINILVAWYWWDNHHGWYLTDSMLLASWNTKLWAVTMLSVPRDLMVYDKQYKYNSRINEIFTRNLGKDKNFNSWAQALIDVFEDIMWIQIWYYAFVDFDWFESLINGLWWIDIEVGQTIHDTTYPDSNLWYLTFHVDAWLNHFDGNTALMYARSRHSTSDFSRSLRQQQIIKAVLEKIKSQTNIFNPSKIKSLYTQYTEIVKTNISMDEILWMVQYAYDINDVFSFGYTTECSHSALRFSKPACFLYPPDRSLFKWASVMIPVWSNPPNVSFYDYTSRFAFFVLHNQEYLLEKAKIVIQNWIDKNYASQQKRKTNGYANQIGIKLKKFAFDIVGVENAKSTSTWTIVYLIWTWDYRKTADILRYFMHIDSVVEYSDQLTWSQITSITWADMVIVLWNSYIDYFDPSQFSYYNIK